MPVSLSTSTSGPDTHSSSLQMAPADRVSSVPNSIKSDEESQMATACTPPSQSPMGSNINSTQVNLAELNQYGRNSITNQRASQEPSPAIRHDTGFTLGSTLSPSPSSPSLSPSSTVKPAMTLTSTMDKLVTCQVTTPQSGVTPQRPPDQPQGAIAGLIAWYRKFELQLSMIGLAFLGLFAALVHHLYNASLNGLKVSGDAQWPPRYGSALSFFVRLVLVASVQIAYKQQAWVH